MQLTFLPAAQKELLDSIAYYEQKAAGLGGDFLDEINIGLGLITTYPESGTLINLYARRVVLNNFPYSIIYRIYQSQIVVLAVMHQRRRPNYWVKRS